MSDFCEHETFKDVCNICHRDKLITALRAEVEDLGNRLHHVHRLWANNEHALRAENERLRAALRGSYEVYAGSDGFIPATAAEGYQQQIIKQMVDCISAALEEKP